VSAGSAAATSRADGFGGAFTLAVLIIGLIVTVAR